MDRGAQRWLVLAVIVAATVVLTAPPVASASLLTNNISPFAQSRVIVGATWTSRRYGPPLNQWGDVLPTIWADDDEQYTIMDDGGTDVPVSGGLWRQSLARITGKPPKIHFRLVGDPRSPPPHTYPEILSNPKTLWTGPLGPYYSSGLVSADHVFFATQQTDWDWNSNGPFAGLTGIAYSLDRGRHWQFGGKQFPAPLGNLSWVVRGQGGFYPDGYLYAIGTEREFNAGAIIMGRSRLDVADVTDPSRWEWLSGWITRDGAPSPVFSNSSAKAVPILSWSSHVTYPEMAYDSPLHRYLLTFTYAYGSAPPGIWQDGAELVILESPRPWGPFSFVAHERNFGPSNGYGAGIPIGWISRSGRDAWMKWAANFDGCALRLDCSGAYGFNYRRLHLTVAGDSSSRPPARPRKR